MITSIGFINDIAQCFCHSEYYEEDYYMSLPGTWHE